MQASVTILLVFVVFCSLRCSVNCSFIFFLFSLFTFCLWTNKLIKLINSCMYYNNSKQAWKASSEANILLNFSSLVPLNGVVDTETFTDRQKTRLHAACTLPKHDLPWPVPNMTYNVFGGTLSLTQSINRSPLDRRQHTLRTTTSNYEDLSPSQYAWKSTIFFLQFLFYDCEARSTNNKTNIRVLVNGSSRASMTVVVDSKIFTDKRLCCYSIPNETI